MHLDEFKKIDEALKDFVNRGDVIVATEKVGFLRDVNGEDVSISFENGHGVQNLVTFHGDGRMLFAVVTNDYLNINGRGYTELYIPTVYLQGVFDSFSQKFLTDLGAFINRNATWVLIIVPSGFLSYKDGIPKFGGDCHIEVVDEDNNYFNYDQEPQREALDESPF